MGENGLGMAAGSHLAGLAALVVALVISLALGRRVIATMADLGVGQRVRDDGPQRHLQKEGTPTMGGVLIVGATVLATALAVLVSGRSGLASVGLGAALPLVATLTLGAVGFADDWLKVKRGRSLGLKARQKLLYQFVAAVVTLLVGQALVLVLLRAAVTPSPGLVLSVGALGGVLVSVLLLVFTSNAVNLADGLDGLATGLCTIAAVGFTVLAWHSGEMGVAVFGLALMGACLGFLWFNRHPARIFMGDVGSLALGGALAAMAIALGSPLALVGLCLVPFLEAASVIIQVISFKTTGKRVFRMSPIHHHFELCGWSERRVVGTFWAVQLVAAIITVALLLAVPSLLRWPL
jgi:phospho-N-acetylmuramoyl-pentapeptide-transferase